MRVYTYNGIQGLSNIAEAYGIPLGTLKGRVRNGKTLHEAIYMEDSRKFNSGTAIHEWNGIKGIKNIASAIGVSGMCLYKHMQSGKTLEEAVNKILKGKKSKVSTVKPKQTVGIKVPDQLSPFWRLALGARDECSMSKRISKPIKQAYVIKIGDRYFTEFGKKGQVLTAWSLAGAETFLGAERMDVVINKLNAKGKKYSVEVIEVQERSGLTLKDFYKLSYQLRRMVIKAEEISQIIGCRELASKISLLSAAVVVLEKEFSDECLKKVGMNISNNLFKYSNPLEYVFDCIEEGLKDRLSAYKEIKKRRRKQHLLEGGDLFLFDADVPF